MTQVTLAPAEALAAIPYFAGLPRSELARLARQGRVRAVARGGRVFDEGAPAEGLWVVLAGRVALVRRSPRGREQVLHTEGPGTALGEAPLFDGEGYVASAVAVDAARVLFLPSAAVLDTCRRHPEVALGILRVLARRVRAFAGLVEDLALRDVTGRLAKFLAGELRRSPGGLLVLPGTREEIAARLGTVRELVSRSLSQLERAGVLTVSGRRVSILDRQRLDALANDTRT